MVTLGNEDTISIFRLDEVGGLNVEVCPGHARVDGSNYIISMTPITLTDASTNYVFVSAGGVVTFNTASFPTDCIPLYEVVTSGGVITGKTDKRSFIGRDTPSGGPDKKMVTFSLVESKTAPYVGSNSGTYDIKGHIPFPGTDAMGTPTSIKLMIWVDPGITGSYRIYDIENSLEIAELGGIINTNKQITDMGTLTNLPTGPSTFEIQIKRTTGTGAPEVCCGGGLIEW